MRKTGVIALRALVLVVLLAGPAWAGLNVWTGGGPEGAAIRAVLVDPLSPTTIYVGTVGSGVFKSINNGGTWTQLSDSSGTLATRTIRALVVSGTGTLYAGADNAVDSSTGVFQSIDGGSSWTLIGTAANGLSNRKVQSLLVDGTTLYAGTREENGVEGGVFKWDGSTWAKKNNGLGPLGFPNNQSARRVQALAVDTRPAVHVIYAGAQGEGVFKTFDGGDNWLRVDNPAQPNQGFKSDCLLSPEILALKVDETVDYPTGTTDATLYAGATGAVPTTDCAAPASRGAGFFKFSPAGPPPAFGQWNRKMNGAFQTLVPTTMSTQVWAIALKRNDPNPPRLYIGTDLGVFTSSDRAGNWDGVPRIALPDNLIGLPIRALGMDPAGGVTLYAGSAGRGMFRRSPNFPAVGEAPWTPINGGLAAIRAQAAAVGVRGGSKVVLQGLSGGGVLTSTVTSISGGTPVWQETSEPDRTVRSIATDPTNATTVYAATGRGVIKSIDGGNSWAPANTGLPTTTTQDPNNPTRTVRSIIVDPADPNTLYAAVGGIFRSVDGGTNWTSANGNLGTIAPLVTTGDGTVAAIVIDQDSAGVDPIWGNLYVATDGQGVFMSTNGGGTWTQFNDGILVADQHILSLALDPLPTPKVLYAGTSTGLVYKRAIGTSSWTSVSSNLAAAAVNGLAVRLGMPSKIYAGLDGGGVYSLPANSSSWTAMNSGLASLNVGGLGFDPAGAGTLYAATLGRGTFHFEFDGGSTPPFVIIDSPPPPTFSTATSPVTITGRAGGGTFGVFWYTNRGHAALLTGTNTWTATVPLEPGANVITITAVGSNTPPNQESQVITVTLVGGGTTTIGLYRPSTNTYYLRNSNTYGVPDITIASWGAPNDIPLVGDWDGNGTTTIGLYRPSTNTYYLRNSNTYGAPDITIASWGAPGDIPVVGDWTGTGTTTIGLYRPSTNTYYLRNSNTYGPPDIIIAGWGAPGDIPVVGDWDGNGTTTIGLYRPSTNTYYLRNSNTYGAPDITIASWGAPNDIPVVGDWDGNGTTTIGLYRPSTNTYYLRNSNSYGAPDITIASWGGAGDIPVVGDWNGGP